MSNSSLKDEVPSSSTGSPVKDLILWGQNLISILIAMLIAFGFIFLMMEIIQFLLGSTVGSTGSTELDRLIAILFTFGILARFTGVKLPRDYIILPEEPKPRE